MEDQLVSFLPSFHFCSNGEVYALPSLFRVTVLNIGLLYLSAYRHFYLSEEKICARTIVPTFASFYLNLGRRGLIDASLYGFAPLVL